MLPISNARNSAFPGRNAAFPGFENGPASRTPRYPGSISVLPPSYLRSTSVSFTEVERRLYGSRTEVEWRYHRERLVEIRVWEGLQERVGELYEESRDDVYRYLLTLGLYPPAILH